MSELTSILEVYSLQEIIEYNDLAEEEVLEYLVEQEILRLPQVKPVDLE